MEGGHLLNQIREKISVSEIEAVLSLVQGGVSQLIGMSPCTLSVNARKMIPMKSWPYRQYSAPAMKAASWDDDFKKAMINGNRPRQLTQGTLLPLAEVPRKARVRCCGAFSCCE